MKRSLLARFLYANAFGLAIGLFLFSAGCGTDRGHDKRLVVVPDESSAYVDARLIFTLGPGDFPSGTSSLLTLAVAEPRSPGSARNLAELQTMNATLRATAGREALIIDIRCPKENWGSAQDVIARQLRSETFDGLEIDVMRSRLLAALDSVRQDALSLANAVFWSHATDSTNAVHPSLGTDESVGLITEDHIKTLASATFNSRNYALGLCGAVGPRDVTAFDKLLQQTLLPGERVTPVTQVVRPRGLNMKIVELSGIAHSVVVLGVAASHRSSDSTSLVMAMSSILQGVRGFALTGMDQALRAERGMVETVDIGTSWIESTQDVLTLRETDPTRHDFITVTLQTKPINALYSARIAIKELTDMNTAGLSAEDIARTRATLNEAQMAHSDVTTRMRVGVTQKWMGADEYSFGDATKPAVSSSRSRQLIRSAFDPQNLWVVVVVPKGEQFRAEVMSGMSMYVYPNWVDQNEIRRLDQEYLSFRPFWQTERVEVMNAADLFR